MSPGNSTAARFAGHRVFGGPGGGAVRAEGQRGDPPPLTEKVLYVADDHGLLTEVDDSRFEWRDLVARCGA